MTGISLVFLTLSRNNFSLNINPIFSINYTIMRCNCYYPLTNIFIFSIRRYLFYKDINWEKPLVPTRMLKKVGRKVTLGYAILDLLAESSLYALYMSDVLDLIRLQNMYPSMYDNMDMDEVAGVVIGAIRQR